ncbi:MAG: excinuclease ABC subunit UvrC [Bacteroidota bacterium]
MKTRALKEREVLFETVRSLPLEPGVYRFLNAKGKIIYIGKAKSLRKRVSSYFANSRPHSYRIRHMVDNIVDVRYTITNSEIEALLLENNLIKRHQPRYNILLKDGKTYPYICVKNERFPRVFSTRTKDADGSLYFGPYPSVTTMKSILNLIRGFISLRTCNYHLSDANIAAGKFKVCLEYQIGNCAAPCVGKQSEEDYNAGIDQVKHILKGNMAPVIRELEQRMKDAAAEFKFEQAEYYRKKIEKVKEYRRKNTVVSGKIGDLEVLSVVCEAHLAIVYHFKVQNGAIVQTHAYEMKRANQEEEGEILTAALSRLMSEDEDLFEEFVVNVELPDPPEEFTFTLPKIGDKKHLVELAEKNCKTLLTEKLYEQTFKKRKTQGEVGMEELQEALHLDTLPDHIECIDNSNFQGNFPVASLVVFKNGKPSKRDYRKFNIKTVEGPNDFASMEEVVYRRFKRLIEEDKPFPKLLVVDGGKGQLSSAAKSLKKLNVFDKVPLIGIAKRLEEIYVPGDSIPLHLDKKSAGLYLIQQLRNEAHRFAITFHRDKRSKGANQRSGLTAVKGIGEESAKKILQTFKSLKKLKAASPEELEAKLGTHKAKLIQEAIQAGVI